VSASIPGPATPCSIGISTVAGARSCKPAEEFLHRLGDLKLHFEFSAAAQKQLLKILNA
jgi:hypothetical protein